MALKNWEKSKKVKRSFKEVKWNNTQDATSISVVFDGEKWRVWLTDTFDYAEELQPLGFDDRLSAMNFARKYMEEN